MGVQISRCVQHFTTKALSLSMEPAKNLGVQLHACFQRPCLNITLPFFRGLWLFFAHLTHTPEIQGVLLIKQRNQETLIKIIEYMIVTITIFLTYEEKFWLHKGPSTNYVSIFEGGGGHKMLTDAYLGEGGVFQMLT